jgi:hypothetical protein
MSTSTLRGVGRLYRGSELIGERIPYELGLDPVRGRVVFVRFNAVPRGVAPGERVTLEIADGRTVDCAVDQMGVCIPSGDGALLHPGAPSGKDGRPPNQRNHLSRKHH